MSSITIPGVGKGERSMKIIGINYSTNSDGIITSTLQVIDEYNDYYNNPDAGRGCIGKKADSVYIGDYDCSELKVGMDIEIFYDKAISTKKGTFQPVKRIEVLK